MYNFLPLGAAFGCKGYINALFVFVLLLYITFSITFLPLILQIKQSVVNYYISTTSFKTIVRNLYSCSCFRSMVQKY
ncbi:Uncharacterized protein TCM_007209 [Theobroma cacao]|uniref:Uncharacterized protein n=1 Tax=Theobroma cacao TaxID=3641 RepID=A0A061E0E0_THECC|nr:Uncharacterized protein TCM_007209 [Theobroma cacao]